MFINGVLNYLERKFSKTIENTMVQEYTEDCDDTLPTFGEFIWKMLQKIKQHKKRTLGCKLD